MRTIFTSIIWVLLVVASLEITHAAYNYIYFPLFDPESGHYEFDSILPDMLLLLVYSITYFSVGILMGWRLRGNINATLSSIFIAVVGLALELSLSTPWFQLMPSHTVPYDHILAFFGFLIPVSSAAAGSYVFCIYTKQ